MKVLSLFDGMSCGQIALKQLGIIPELYYASEIDKHAIKQTQLNFPDTIQLGDVTKWKKWDIDWKSIDLVLAGSPCQGFSFAGKQLAFDDPRSKLFFVFIDILNHIKKLNPDVLFLLENVNMKKAHMRIISEYCGVFPVNINSNLVSAQNRDRWYWTNIRTKQVGLFGEVYVDIPQPEDRGIVLRDILESEVDEKYYVTSKCLDYITKDFRLAKGYTQIESEDKALPLMAKSYTNWCGDYVCVFMRGREDGLQHLESQNTGKTNCLTSVQKDNLILQRPRGNNKGGLFEGKTPTLSACAWEQNNLLCERQRRNYKSQDEKASAFLSTSHKGSQANGMTLVKSSQQVDTDRIRRLTPTECSRLQTVPAWYRWEMTGRFLKINYVCNHVKCKNVDICKTVNVQLTDAKIKSQLNKLNCAQSITNNFSEMVCYQLEDAKLINQNRVSSKDAITDNKQKKAIVSCTIKDSLGTEQLNSLIEYCKGIESVTIVIRRLAKTEGKECVVPTIKCIDYTETHCILSIKEEFRVQEGIFEIHQEFQFTEKLWSNISEENYTPQRLYTISTLTRQIIESVICTYARINPSILLSMQELELSNEKELRCHICYLETQNEYVSDSAIYKMLGNGWTIDAIVHILSFMKNNNINVA